MLQVPKPKSCAGSNIYTPPNKIKGGSVYWFEACPWADPEQGEGDLDPPPPEKSQVAKGFLRNTGMNPPPTPLEKQLDPKGPIAS